MRSRSESLRPRACPLALMLAVAGHAACADPNVVLLLPSDIDDWGSAVLHRECAGEAPFLYAFDKHSAAPKALDGPCSEGGRITLARFTETLAELELSAGEFPFVPCTSGSFDAEGCCLTRGLPAPETIYEATLDEASSSFRPVASPALDFSALRHRRSGLSLSIVGRERTVGILSLLALPWTDDSFLLLEERREANVSTVRIRPITMDDARAGRALSVPPIAELAGLSRLAQVARLDSGELLIAAASGPTWRGPPSGPFTKIEHESTWIAELLVEPARQPERIYGISEYTGEVARLEGGRWLPFGPEVPRTRDCRHPAGRAGQTNASIWHDGAGYLVPAAGDDHSVVWPNGMWRIRNDTIDWMEWPDQDHCVSVLENVGGVLWAGTGDGVLFEYQDERFSMLELPQASDRVSRILPLSAELTAVMGESGFLGITDGESMCAVPELFTGVAPLFKTAHRVGNELLIISSEGDLVKTLLVVSL